MTRRSPVFSEAVAFSFFPGPARSFVPGGAHLAIYLVPVYQGGLVVFDVSAREARGRWLPWSVLPFRGNPYEEAAALADDWCEGALADLRLVDVISAASATGSWELAIVFRAELTAMPAGNGDRQPERIPAAAVESIGPFDAVDLQRWVAAYAPGHPAAPDTQRPGLIF